MRYIQLSSQTDSPALMSRAPPSAGSCGHRQRPWAEALDELRGRDPFAGRAQADRGGQRGTHVVGRVADRGAVRERHRAVALGQALAVRAEHERNVRVARRRKPEALRQPQLARGGVEEIRAAYHFADALLGVVDDHRHVVRDRAIVAPYDEVVDHALLLSGDPVAKSDARPAGSHAQRRCAAARAPLGALALGERQAGAGIGPIRDVAVGRRGRLADLAARAPALIDQALGVQAVEGLLVELESLRLAHDGAVPVEPQRREVVELLVLEVAADTAGVEILHPHQEARVLAAGEEPGQQGRAEVAEMEGPGRAWRKAAVEAHTGKVA